MKKFIFVFAGARYYFADKIAVFTEAGYGFNFLKTGLRSNFETV